MSEPTKTPETVVTSRPAKGKLPHLPGLGILRGMAVTARNFVGSYFQPERLTTVQYPEERDTLPENARNFPFLVYDGDDAENNLRCVGLPDLRKSLPPAVHLHRQRARREG